MEALTHTYTKNKFHLEKIFKSKKIKIKGNKQICMEH